MIEPLQFFPTNWIDGMKIMKQHFVDSENAFRDELRDCQSIPLTSYNYGLIAPLREEESLKCWFSTDNQCEWNLKVTNCRAVTAAGARIEITQHTANKITNASAFVEAKINVETFKDDVLYLVLISTNPFDRQVAGIPLLEEIPPRYPFTQSTNTLSVLPSEQLPKLRTSGYDLIIGQIYLVDGFPRWNDNYIPPCATVNAHPKLLSLYERVNVFLSQTELYLIAIMQKIHLKQGNELAEGIWEIANQLIQYLNTKMGLFKFLISESPPVFMLDIVAGLARTFKNAMDQRANDGKTEILQHFWEWCGHTPAEIESITIQCANLNYQHNNMNSSIVSTVSFLELFSKLLERLWKLDVIGKKYDGNIFVKEESQADEEYLNKHKVKNRFFTD
ncbi:hypothetical protein DVR12_07540 [Chitinophaga silvatica]|uniref:Uncharacterized protein n=1 Tax=Chitinophaga silvatica TaxID=2282649 RepID=A0A3E1YEW8_9BACT|nr:hypothetical protein [Chitinophaga silvatica]RFS25029.1 hypothetical protein DVR12_07540 [Chitinophaga silvatica]